MLALAVLPGCAGGSALMHPAHTLPSSAVTMGAGVQSNFLFGDGSARIDAARSAAGGNNSLDSTAEERAYVEGAIAHVMFAPGLSPWVGARVGVGYETEAGLTYTGRTARVDGRHAFQTRDLAVSVGLGGSAVLSRGGQEGTDDPVGREAAVPGLDTHPLTGWGIDVPVIVGWRSDADLIQVYAGVRGAHERVFGDILIAVNPYLDPGTGTGAAELDAARWSGGGLVGMRVSIEPLWVGVEVGAGWGHINGTITSTDQTTTVPRYDVVVEGVTLSPAGAFGGRF